ncbi:Pimeloyl-ACP methyl ester carboxylesterase [Micromonospora phaseoli]|uniref:Pimeloyl-ACP methyl ester carboxylesterase n=1 Tax=Micromonospora phaseoli TaxID=1144548 RepID=A0A1H7CJV9_9ACTN|nr:alpha/beta hydrolase [Micromonospora phaseoli]PZV97911.1 pimeloyl-ACP methyl ester carboxylesterase [Micromonospora phaseoli]GIJ78578.1 alpha/beta hydrolase [Micromonospora phaseoli]SEJ87432.1 Pimeloyl-ACP methyl ester carboxylesterase [Micromonospora phaseoli]
MPEPIRVRLGDDVHLHVETTGPADAEVTAVLLHGWTLDGRSWHRQLTALREAFGSIRVVTYDARGHGRSSCMALPTATLAQLGDDLAAVLDEVAPAGPVVLVGHSLGGMTIMEYAHRHPEHFSRRTAGLVFVSTTAEGHTHTVYGLSPRIARIIRLAETTGAGLLARCGAWRPPRALLRALRPSIRWMLFGDRCDPTDIRLVTSAVARASLRSIGGFRASIGTQHRLATLAALAHLPAAALVGDRDRLTPTPCAESIAAALPDTELTVCPGAGHMLMMERPDEVNAALHGVLRRVLDAVAARSRIDG